MPCQVPEPEIPPPSEHEQALNYDPYHKENRRLNALQQLLIGASFEHFVPNACRTERCVRL